MATLYTHTGADAVDAAAWPKADVVAEDGSALYTFSGDTKDGDATGASADWSVYTGTTKPAEPQPEQPAPAGTPAVYPSTPATPAASEVALTTSQDVFVNPDIKLLAARPTMVGSDGIERIAGPSLTDWTPAPTEASPEAVAQLEAFNAFHAAAKEERQNMLAPAVAK